MKKTIAILMSLVMALSVFAMAVSAEGVQDLFYHPLNLTFEEGDFAVGEVTGDPAGTGLSISGLISNGGKAAFKDVGDKYGKVLALTSVNGAGGDVGFFAKSKAKGWEMSELGRKVTFSADLNVKAVDGATADDYNIHIAINLKNANAGNFVVLGNGFGGKGTVWGGNNAEPAAKAEAFTPGKWFHLDIEMDFDGNTLKAYIDDKLVITQPIVGEGVNTANVELGTGVVLLWKNGPAGREVMIDNIYYSDSIKDRTSQGGNENDKPNPPTSDFAYAVTVVAVISLAGAVVIGKKAHR